jgi:hypothetical protein
MKTCKFKDCNKKHDSHGFCIQHARQFRKYGYPLTEEEKHEHWREAAKGRKQTLGKHWIIKDTSKMKGHHPKSEFKKGQPSHNKGKSNWMTPEHKDALRQANIGRPAWNKGKKGVMPRPWNKVGDGITAQDRLDRVDFRRIMQKVVFERDDYTCQICEQQGGSLQVHHKQGWRSNPELRYEIDNCQTLCMACHYYITFKKHLTPGMVWGHNMCRKKVS